MALYLWVSTDVMMENLLHVIFDPDASCILTSVSIVLPNLSLWLLWCDEIMITIVFEQFKLFDYDDKCFLMRQASGLSVCLSVCRSVTHHVFILVCFCLKIFLHSFWCFGFIIQIFLRNDFHVFRSDFFIYISLMLVYCF